MIGISEHIPSGFCTYTKYVHGDSQTYMYRGRDLMPKLAKYLEQEAIRLTNIPHYPMICMTAQEMIDHDLAINCHICESEFGDPDSLMPGSTAPEAKPRLEITATAPGPTEQWLIGIATYCNTPN